MRKRTVTALVIAAVLAVAPATESIVTITASAAENENVQKIFDGSFAYFQDKGASEALDVLNNSKYASYTVKGDENERDATSLRNMTLAINWLKECNTLREQNGLEPLLVNDEMMAMAQADANYSDAVHGHAEQFNVGENCAWNSGSNPFVQWYNEEKEKYEAMTSPGWSNETGHYLNIINPSYKTTGFAVCTKGTKSPYTYVQVFSNNDGGITVEEYEKQLREYMNLLFDGDSGASGDNGNNNGSGDNGSSDVSGNEGNSSQPGKTGSPESGFEAMKRVNFSIKMEIERAAEKASEAGISVGRVVIDGNDYGINAFYIDTMKELNEANVDAVLKYDYEGYHYEILIPAGEAPVYEDIPWYGPMYLYGSFLDTATVTPIE